MKDTTMQILVWKGKHSDSYYDATTDEALQAASRSIIKELVEYGYVYEPEAPREETEQVKELLALTPEEVEAIPASVRGFTQNEIRRHKARIAADESAKAEWEEAVAHSKGEDVARLVMKRDDPRWEKVVEAAAKKPEIYREREEGMFRVVTPWSFLSDRSGFEYEDYELVTVQTVTP